MSGSGSNYRARTARWRPSDIETAGAKRRLLPHELEHGISRPDAVLKARRGTPPPGPEIFSSERSCDRMQVLGHGPPDREAIMLQGWIVIAVALGYIGLLFLVASYGDRTRRFGREGRSRLLIYPLSLAIYCTSWTFFGSVGLASRNGFDFLTIYVGPILVIGLCSPLIMRI